MVTTTEQAVYAEQRCAATDLIGNALMAEGKGGCTIRDEQTPLQDIEHYIGCPSDAADQPYAGIPGERGRGNER